MLDKIIKFLLNKEIRFGYCDKLGLYNRLSDEDYIKKRFYTAFGYELDLNNLCTFNEKLQWIKLFDRRKMYTELVDKYLVKKYVCEKIGKDHIIPTIGVWDDPYSIDFDELPNQFVLKCNHNSGVGMCICKDKTNLNYSLVRTNLNKGMHENYYLRGREWPYKNVKRKIIAEKYMGDNLIDYKFQCFNGKIDNILVCRNRNSSTGVEYYYFDSSWNYLPYSKQVDLKFKDFNQLKPKNLGEMINIAKILSKEIPEVRVDLYQIEDKVFFGEMTFFTQSGFDTTITSEADKIMGEHLILEN